VQVADKGIDNAIGTAVKSISLKRGGCNDLSAAVVWFRLTICRLEMSPSD
jgi:hypothetical protein